MVSKFVVALGGNAILQRGQKGTSQEQFGNVLTSCEEVVRLMEAGHELLITHGNGPQVGTILIQQAAAKDKVPAQSLDICGAQSQGMIGYFIQQSFQNLLREKGMDKKVVTVLTQVLVDKDDPAFSNPTKPVGPFYSEEEAIEGKKRGEHWVNDSGRGYRKVVASPKPKAIVERDVIAQLLQQGVLVIASGGGGIPVYEEEGRLSGTEAVIDKDLAAALIARELEFDGLLILTDVPFAFINYGTPEQEALGEISVVQAEDYYNQGQFGAGSMGPKVLAAITAAKSGKTAVITSLDQAVEALAGNTGTRIIP